MEHAYEHALARKTCQVSMYHIQICVGMMHCPLMQHGIAHDAWRRMQLLVSDNHSGMSMAAAGDQVVTDVSSAGMGDSASASGAQADGSTVSTAGAGGGATSTAGAANKQSAAGSAAGEH